MGTESTDLTSAHWIAVDAGATRIRVAPVQFMGMPRLLNGILKRDFRSDQGPERVAQAMELIREVARQQDWNPPYCLALAWAGAPTPDGRGIEQARYGPAIPDLVERLTRGLPIANRPVLQSDARAALQGGVLRLRCRSAYALISGSGLGEAYYSEGLCWSRQQFRQRFGSAAEFVWQDRDAESWLRTADWSGLDHPDPKHLQVLEALVAHRCSLEKPERILLGGHFLRWFEEGRIPPRLGGIPVTYLEPDWALEGCCWLEMAPPRA